MHDNFTVVSIVKSTFRPLQFNYLSYELQRQEMSHFGIKKNFWSLTENF